jgi:hypothetical protein
MFLVRSFQVPKLGKELLVVLQHAHACRLEKGVVLGDPTANLPIWSQIEVRFEL